MRDVISVNKVTVTLSDEQMTKTKIVGLDELCNLCVHHFLIWNYLVPQIFVRSLNILKFKFQTIETKSYEEITKTKLVDLDVLYNFVSDIVSIFNRLLAKIIHLKS